MRLTSLLFITISSFTVIGCAATAPTINQTKQQDIKKETGAPGILPGATLARLDAADDIQLYGDAKSALQAGRYARAAELLDTLALRYPFGNHTQQALLETAEDSYKRGQGAATVTAAERFINANPNHPHVDHAYYHRGLAAFYEGMHALESAVPATTKPQDSAPARHAFQTLAALLRHTPTSKFATDTTQRMLHIRNALAKHEVDIARHYLTQGDRNRAAARAKYVVDNYQQAPAVAEALSVLTQANAPGTMAQMPEVAQRREPLPDAPAAATAPGSVTAMAAPAKTWLLSQNPEHYTLQLFSARDEQVLKKHIAQHHLQGKADYFRSGATTYSLVHGVYPSKDAALRAAKKLPVKMFSGSPWIRSFRSIHDTLKKVQAPATAQ